MYQLLFEDDLLSLPPVHYVVTTTSQIAPQDITVNASERCRLCVCNNMFQDQEKMTSRHTRLNGMIVGSRTVTDHS